MEASLSNRAYCSYFWQCSFQSASGGYFSHEQLL